MNTSPKIIFFGTEEYNSLITLKNLVETGKSIAAVVTKPDAPKGRGKKLTPPAVKVYAEEHGIPVWQPQKLSEITENLRNLAPVVGILVAYGKIIPQATLDLFTPGIINLHPSLLPLWRGPSPIESAIANQNPETGMTIMKLEAGMDSGPIYLQQKIALNGTETQSQLYEQLFTLGSQMLVDNLDQIISGELQPTEQNHQLASYCQYITKKDSFLSPEEMTAHQAEAQVRAHLSFPKTRLIFKGQTLIITRAEVSKKQKSPLSIKFKDDNYLQVDELVAPSGKTMTSEAYLRGLRR